MRRTGTGLEDGGAPKGIYGTGCPIGERSESPVLQICCNLARTH